MDGPNDPHQRPSQRLNLPLVFAHRGASAEAPENTYPAFALAKEMGADVFETDVHWTKDGVIVVAHDPDVSRMTNGQGLIQDMTYAELLELDFGYRFTMDGGETFPYRGRGVKIMRFFDLLSEFPNHPVNVDLKPKEPPLLRQYIEEVYEADAMDRVMTASFHDSVLQKIRQQNPRLATSASPREIAKLVFLQRIGLAGLIGRGGGADRSGNRGVGTVGGFSSSGGSDGIDSSGIANISGTAGGHDRRSRSVPYRAIQVPPAMYGIHVITEGLIRAAHQKRVQVHVWTIDDKDEMKALLDLGVDGIMSNRPGVARSVVDNWAPPLRDTNQKDIHHTDTNHADMNHTNSNHTDTNHTDTSHTNSNHTDTNHTGVST